MMVSIFSMQLRITTSVDIISTTERLLTPYGGVDGRYGIHLSSICATYKDWPKISPLHLATMTHYQHEVNDRSGT